MLPSLDTEWRLLSTYACPRNRNLNKIIAIAWQVGFPPDLNRSQIYPCLLSHTNPSVQITIPSGLGDCLPSGRFAVGSNLPPIFAPDGSRQPAGFAAVGTLVLATLPSFHCSQDKGQNCPGPHVRAALTRRCRRLSLPHLLVPACHRRGGPSFPLPGRLTILHPFCLLLISADGPFLREALPG